MNPVRILTLVLVILGLILLPMKSTENVNGIKPLMGYAGFRIFHVCEQVFALENSMHLHVNDHITVRKRLKVLFQVLLEMYP